MKQCPSCESALDAAKIGPVEIDECRRCRGIWFGKDKLRQAKDAIDPDLNWLDFDIWKHEGQFSSHPSELRCPACSRPMAAIHYGESGIAIEYCAICEGAWLHRREFRKIIESLEKELDTKPFSDYVRNAVREGLEVVKGPESLLSEWRDFATVLRLMEYRFFVEHPVLMRTLTGIQRTLQ